MQAIFITMVRLCKRDFSCNGPGQFPSVLDTVTGRDLDPCLPSGGIVACSVARNNAKLYPSASANREIYELGIGKR